MEKEKKVVKKATKKTERKQDNYEIVFNKDTKKVVKVVSLILVFLAAIAAIFVFVFGIITSIKVANTDKLELLKDNFSVTFVSNVNNIPVNEAENLIQGYGSKALFITFDIVIPCLAIMCVSILLIIFAKKVMDFMDSVKKEKDLFTKEKLHNIEKMACIVETMLTISFVIFSRPSIILYLFVSILLFIIIGLFRRCVENNK